MDGDEAALGGSEGMEGREVSVGGDYRCARRRMRSCDNTGRREGSHCLDGQRGGDLDCACGMDE